MAPGVIYIRICQLMFCLFTHQIATLAMYIPSVPRKFEHSYVGSMFVTSTVHAC